MTLILSVVYKHHTFPFNKNSTLIFLNLNSKILMVGLFLIDIVDLPFQLIVESCLAQQVNNCEKNTKISRHF